MVSTCPLISKSASTFTNPLEIVPSAPITISITVPFIFHCLFFSSLARSTYLSLYSLSFNAVLWSVGTTKSTIRQVLFSFFLFFFRLSLGVVIWSRSADLFVSQNPRELWKSHSPEQILCWALFVWSNLNFLHNFPWITFPTQSCLV